MTTNKKQGVLRIWIGGSIIILIAGLGLLSMVFKEKTTLAKETAHLITAEQQGPVVKVIRAGMTQADKGLVLVGEVRPYQEVVLYAKTGGYMNKIMVDKGDKVREGQLLATIVSPETDEAYRAAIADLANKKKIADRDRALVTKEYVSKEDAETSQTAVDMAEAQVKSLKEQMAYKNIIAPFAGTITARFADPGALVQNATSSQTSAQPVVTLSQLDKIRIYAYAPQADAARLSVGYPATITMAERPALKIKAAVSRIAGELDPKTRMMLVEIDLPNTKDPIIPGSYVQVAFDAPIQKNLTIPAEALVVRGGNYYAPVIADSILHYQPIIVDNNNGVVVSVKSGINVGDMVGLNVSPELSDGQKVRIQL